MSEDTKDIVDRWAAATPGPWTACVERMYVYSRTGMVADDGLFADDMKPGEEMVARIRGVGSGQPQETNIIAIAHAPEDVARLLAKVGRLTIERDRLARAIDRFAAVDAAEEAAGAETGEKNHE